MRLMTIISILALMLLLIGCASEKAAPEEQSGAVSEPTAEQIESDLNTAYLDEIESDIDSLILE